LGSRGRNVRRREQIDISSASTSSLRLSGTRSAAITADRLAVVVLGSVAAIAALTFRDFGLGWDDYTHSQYGDLLLALYSSGFGDQRALSFVNLYKYGGGFDMAAALAAKVLPFGLFETRRLVGAAVGIIGLIATWRIGRPSADPRQSGGARIARGLPALLRPHVHQCQGRAVRCRDDGAAARHGACV
jgi:hypothetical protein